ncbi:aldehyde dehydrogenase family protein [Gimibacter soli]|uniref:Aldehyde dehydrogenase family protein n=1 Tax=Gimibacter soli TaxID=3024400 RepID=A0AAE9XM46_9PROT|nr:aldehyde dehydrogenase family protein [Gimibacter soli]WCL53408.1 aldehyde dehydrogenase family protein [Gimibacter soli]
MTDFKLLIGGELVEGDLTLDVVNPATEAVFATVARASEKQAHQAVAAAKAAFPGWAATPLADRQAAVAKLADRIAENAEELARILTSEQGKPLPEAMGELAWTEGYLRHYATLGPSSHVIQDDDAFRIEVRREPLGVVAGIVPWNFPLLVACWKIGPAVIAGNTIVIKTSPTTPATTLKIGEYCRDIFPAGVVNIITDNNELGPLLTGHPDVAKVSFTGSTETGKKIASNGANTLKRLTLELGGNDAAIVLDDVNIPAAAAGVFGAATLNAGQVCLAVKRAYVHDSIYDEMCDALADLARQAVVDDGLKQGTTIGPLQNRMQFEKVKGFLEDAKAAGKVIAGGNIPDREGYFIEPTIVRDVKSSDRIVAEEQFGPILPVIRYSDIDAVLAEVNGTDYGLGGSVWSGNVERAVEVATRIESGSVWVNQHINIGPHIPMSGYKSSGVGIEQAQEGLDEFTQMRVINIARQPV